MVAINSFTLPENIGFKLLKPKTPFPFSLKDVLKEFCFEFMVGIFSFINCWTLNQLDDIFLDDEFQTASNTTWLKPFNLKFCLLFIYLSSVDLKMNSFRTVPLCAGGSVIQFENSSKSASFVSVVYLFS